MIKILAVITVGSLAVSTPAAANHAFDLDTPYASRGECELANVQLSNGDTDMLLNNFPQLFSTPGEVRSFLTRAFTCELDGADGQWYIRDHRVEVINSDWFERRLD